MAPAVVEKAAQAGSASKEFKKESATARLLGSGAEATIVSKENFADNHKVLLVSQNSPSFTLYVGVFTIGVADESSCLCRSTRQRSA